MIRLAEILAGVVAISLLAALYVAKTGASGDQAELAELQAELARERGRVVAEIDNSIGTAHFSSTSLTTVDFPTPEGPEITTIRRESIFIIVLL